MLRHTCCTARLLPRRVLLRFPVQDTLREGDAGRMRGLNKVLMGFFRETGHTKYALEGACSRLCGGCETSCCCSLTLVMHACNACVDSHLFITRIQPFCTLPKISACFRSRFELESSGIELARRVTNLQPTSRTIFMYDAIVSNI